MHLHMWISSLQLGFFLQFLHAKVNFQTRIISRVHSTFIVTLYRRRGEIDYAKVLADIVHCSERCVCGWPTGAIDYALK